MESVAVAVDIQCAICIIHFENRTYIEPRVLSATPAIVLIIIIIILVTIV